MACLKSGPPLLRQTMFRKSKKVMIITKIDDLYKEMGNKCGPKSSDKAEKLFAPRPGLTGLKEKKKKFKKPVDK